MHVNEIDFTKEQVYSIVEVKVIDQFGTFNDKINERIINILRVKTLYCV